MRWVLDTDPKYMVTRIAALFGIGAVLDFASEQSLGDSRSAWEIFRFAALWGAILGVSIVYIFGALLSWTGKWIGGQANGEQARAAFAWGSVLDVWMLLLWVPYLVLFGKEPFTSDTPGMDANPSLVSGLTLVGMTIGIWSLVVGFKCIGEAQGFSAWRALGNAILAVLVFGAVVIAAIVAANLAGLLH